MAIARPAVSSLVRPDGLAVGGADVFRSGVEMNGANDTQAKLQHAKERLYVFCQLGGWGVFLSMQIGFARVFGRLNPNLNKHDELSDAATLGMVILLGIVLTHYARPLMTRWGWKEMSWRALVPRVLGMAAFLSLLWMLVGFGYTYGVMRTPWPTKFSPMLLMLTVWVQGVSLFVGWLCLYFFYHIFERLNRLQVEQLRLTASVKEAELRALKSQINPHFLFNSLNSLRALIDEDAPRARESVTRLANMLRYSLQSGQLETVPLEEELRIVEDYLALEQIRHENRLRVRWDITEEVRQQAVPPMLLQTLVENAVKYGISVRREGGELAISARIEANCIHIRVTNPGEINAPSSDSALRAGSSTGVGLRNASERLKLLFGEQATLQLLSGGVDLVTADVCIPLKSATA
jgi:two-component sensor histidine kinase